MDYESYMGVVAPFAGNFAPKNWLLCQGQLLSIPSNTALFALLGTTYGGNGVQTFALPNLGGRMALGAGDSTSGTHYTQGEVAGTENVSLLPSNMAAHTHTATATASVNLSASSSAATLGVPAASSTLASANGNSGRDPVTVNLYAPAPGTTSIPATATLNPQLEVTGANQPVALTQPFLALSMCICIYGVFPSRN
ncbi:phage tail protein [Pseudomonas lopnurensis]|uniref:phage tail protein n=1 Tax=Pseudomonas lopnurensis TaxID=1477517 RepID=UPI00187AD004|nr:tail fiber protein [Pseudomonas lopnurensis]MBE7373376.1 tail fiber protein [Pseudomonas lopnurensis]